MGKSIYQRICDNLKDGSLNPLFSLVNQSDPTEFKWAPGAFDGMCLYHMEIGSMNSDAVKEMVRALKAASCKDFQLADKLFADLGDKHRAIAIVDELQRYLYKHAECFDMNSIYGTAMYLLLSSEYIESVKFGLEMIELFGEPGDDIKKIIRRIGLYDEFTIFAVWNMQTWENGNSEIFELAKKTTGWGRIHAVYQMKPETEEIKYWLLTEGSKNGVTPAYSSLVCWEKSDAEKLLWETISHDIYKGICVLIDGLIDEGPVPGISAVDNAEAVILQFLKQSANFGLSWENYETIRIIRLWAEEKNSENVVLECKMLLTSPECVAVVSSAVKFGKALKLAEELSIPYLDALYECMRQNFDEHYYNCAYLMNSPEHFEKTVDLFRNHLPLSEMTGKYKGTFAVEGEFEKYNQLVYVLQELREFPKMGIDIVTTGLCSPYTRTRNQAVRCLKSWVQMTGRPLLELSSELFASAQQAIVSETDKERIEILTCLLKGETNFQKKDDIDETTEVSEEITDE